MNKDIETTKYLQKLKNIKLSESARSRIQNNLLEYARFHSVRVEGESRFIKQVPQRTSLFTLFKQPKSMTAALIAIMMIVGGGTSFAASGAVPGDFLYPVKIEVNENFQSAFAISNEAEAKLQVKLAEERLKEAEELAARGELTAETSAKINANLKAHYDDASERSNRADGEGDYESSASVRASLEGAFRTHADILDGLNASVTGNNGISLITSLRAYADDSAQAQVKSTTTIESSASTKVAIESTIKRTDNLIAEAKAKMTKAKSKISAEAYARVEAKLAEAITAQAEAKTAFQAESYQVAYASVQTAIKITKEVETMTDSLLRLKVQINTGTDNILDNVIDIKNDSNPNKDSEAGTSTKSDVDNGYDVDLDINGSVDVKTSTGTNKTPDPKIIDIEAKTNTSVQSGLNL